MYNDFDKTEFPSKGEDVAASENITALINETRCLINDALTMAYRLNQHLFGFGEPMNDAKQLEPKCYRDEVVLHTKLLKKLCDELSKTLREIGV